MNKIFETIIIMSSVMRDCMSCGNEETEALSVSTPYTTARFAVFLSLFFIDGG